MTKKRGRKSGDSLSLVTPVPLRQHPEPPDYLPEAEAEIWHRVAKSKPADWWDNATCILLEQYCRIAVTARQLAPKIRELASGDLSNLDTLNALKKFTAMHDMQTMRMTTLATAMRLTQQSRYGARTAARKAEDGGTRPWDL